MKKTKYIVEHDPLSWTGLGSFIVKMNNGAKTPYAVVLIPHGNKDTAKKSAKDKADKIAKALHFYDQIKES